MRLLLIEDDALLGKGIHSGLTQAGYAVDWVKDGNAAELALLAEEYDLAVLDIGLPIKSGLEVLRTARDKGKDLPFLILTARDTINDRVKGLDEGADDYMVKPFDLDELHARIRALLRRRAARASPVIKHANIELDPASHTVMQDEKIIDLPPREYAILHTLLDNVGRVMSKTRLEESLYSWKDEIESNAVEVHIHHLRKKLGSDLIRTIRGVGYIVDKEK
jgi:two-component system response regulator QseB